MLTVLKFRTIGILGLLLLSGCAESKLEQGAFCTSDAQCRSGLCAGHSCLSPEGDEDNDGLSNQVEKAVGANPFLADSDWDAKLDRTEVGPQQGSPLDSDNDGLPNVLESAFADADGDCLPDEYDPSPQLASPEALVVLCSQEGVCATSTTAFCDGGTLVCTHESDDFQPNEQRCDGLDNDCDGHTDEGFNWVNSELGVEYPVGTPCKGLGECGWGTTQCAPNGESAECSSVLDDFEPERCDGLDNDCDGLADEGLSISDETDAPAIGHPCKAQGVCSVGIVECASDDGLVVCSTAPGGSQYVEKQEICNGFDDDCDGETDEDFVLIEGKNTLTLGTPCGLGACVGGSTECAPHQLGLQCSTHNLATNETCNLKDDDCNGIVDDAPDPGVSGCPQQGLCADASVLEPVCDEGKWLCKPTGSLYQAGQEKTCDGLDNDCDGLVDESFVLNPVYAPDLSLPIGAECGTGECAGGVVECAEQGDSAVCSTSSNSVAEVCDGKDNDCDGLVDEGMQWNGGNVGDACDGTGECGEGTVTCNSKLGKAVCSTNPDGLESQAQEEQCNNKDDDCDGVIDNDWVIDATLCLGLGVCGSGLGIPTACDAGVAVCNYTTTVESYQEGTETLCDDLDNDCDGAVDEYLPRKPASGWEKLASGTPPPRYEMVATVRPDGIGGASNVIVVTGGVESDPLSTPMSSNIGGENDTWRYQENGIWDEIAKAGPPLRAGASFVSDLACNRMILFGGVKLDGTVSNEVWSLDETWNWTQLSPSGPTPPGRANHVATVDPTTGWMWVAGGEPLGSGTAVAALSLSDCSNEPKWIVGLKDGPGWRGGAKAVYLAPDVDNGDASGWIMVFGGESPTGEFTSDSWILDLDAAGWTPVSTQPAPSPRRDHQMAYAQGNVYLFGGVGPAGKAKSDLWRFDPKELSWKKLAILDGPSARNRAAFVPRNDGIVLLGGTADGDELNDAWLLELGESPIWKSLATKAAPVARADAYMTLDNKSDGVLLYGGIRYGLSGTALMGDLWRGTPDEGTWKLLDESGPKRWRAAVAHDSTMDRLIVHGGFTAGNPVNGKVPSKETWVYSAGQWSLKQPANAGPTPPGLAGHAGTWDSTEQRMLLLGGQKGPVESPTTTGELWSYSPDDDKFVLIQITGDQPEPNHGHRLVYDPKGHRLLSIGGTTQKKLSLLNLTTYLWTSIDMSNTTLGQKPFSVLEPNSGLLTVAAATLSGGKFWVVDLDTESVLAWPATTAPPALHHAASVMSQVDGRTYLFGGVDPRGRTRDALWSLPFVCE